MKKNSLLLLVLMGVYSFTFTTQRSLASTIENTPFYSTSDSHQSFLPVVLKYELQGYFVAPYGSDDNPGTLELPWQTIGKAAEMLREGDTVYIREGVYTESARFSYSGSKLNPIRIMAYPGENPVIDGENTIPEPGGTLLRLYGDYIYASGLEVRNSAYAGIGVFGDYDVVDNMFVHHSQEQGIIVSYGQYSIVENSRIWRNAISNEYGQGGGYASGLSVIRNGVAYATIRNNLVWENWGDGIASSSADNIVIEGNIVHDNYSINIYLTDSTNILCQRNFVYADPSSYVYPYDTNGFSMGDEGYDPPSANITIINNIAYGNYVNLWWWQGGEGGGMNNVLIANNTFVNAFGEPERGRGNVLISQGDHVNVVFTNNLVMQDGDLPVIATIDQPGVTYSYNLWSKEPYDAASGPGDVIGDPMLMQVGEPFFADWFRLMDTSPAIGAAISLPDVSDDFFASLRDVAPDMGAVEYVP